MAISLTEIANAATKTTAATQSVTVPAGGVPNGCVIFMHGGAQLSSTPSVSVTDSASNSYVNVVQQWTLSDWLVVLMMAWNSVAALVSTNTITLTWGGTVINCMGISAYYATGLQTSANPTDVTGTSSSGSVTSTGSVAQTGELIIGVGHATGGTGNTFTQDSTHQGGFVGGGLNTGAAPQRTGTSGGNSNTNLDLFAGAVVGWTGSGSTVTYAPTDSGSVHAMIIATFKPPAALVTGWFPPPSDSPPHAPVRDQVGAGTLFTPAPPVGISGMAWFEPPDRDRPATKVTVESPPAIALTPATLPPMVAGMAWFEPPDRDRPATKINGESPGAYGAPPGLVSLLQGMPWHNPPDRNMPAVKINGEAPPAIALTPATLPPKVSGLGWFQPWDLPNYTKPARTDPPAFTVPIVPAVGISGIGWFAPPDRDKPAIRINGVASEQPPAINLTPITLPPQIAGMAWHEHFEEAPPRKPPPDTSGTIGLTPPAAAATTPQGWFVDPQDLGRRAPPFDQPVAVPPSTPAAAPQGWFVDPQDLGRRPVLFDHVSTPPIAIAQPPTGWAAPPDQPIYGRPARTEAAAFALPIVPAVGISGVAWFTPPDPFQPRPRPYLIDVVAQGPSPPFVTVLRGWFAPPDRDLPLRRPTVEQPAAFALPVVPAVGISGVAWFTPPDPYQPRPRPQLIDVPGQPRPPAFVVTINGWFQPWDLPVYGKRVTTESPPAIALTPATLPPQISGMAWFQPWDQPIYGRRAFTDPQPFFFVGTKVPISGMAWFEPPDRDRPAVRVTVEAPPAIALTPATLPPQVSGMAWFQARTDLLPPRRIIDVAPIVVTPPTAPPVGWRRHEETRLLLPQRLFESPAAFAPPSVAVTPPLPISARVDEIVRRRAVSDLPPTTLFIQPPAAVPTGWQRREESGPIIRPRLLDIAAVTVPPPAGFLPPQGWFPPPADIVRALRRLDAEIARPLQPPTTAVVAPPFGWWPPVDERLPRPPRWNVLSDIGLAFPGLVPPLPILLAITSAADFAVFMALAADSLVWAAAAADAPPPPPPFTVVPSDMAIWEIDAADIPLFVVTTGEVPSMGTYDIDSEVQVLGTFANAKTGVAADPTTVTLFLQDPTGNTQQFGYNGGAGPVVKLGTGSYAYSLDANISGVWTYKWQGTGAVVVTSPDTQFTVRASALIPG